MQMTPTIAIHLSAALGALALGPVALWARATPLAAPRRGLCLGHADADHGHLGPVHPGFQPAQSRGLHAHPPAGAGDLHGPVRSLLVSGPAQHPRPPALHAVAVLDGLRV